MEDTPTYASIDTTETEKRRIARQSLEFNLKSKVFREHFPHLCKKPKPAAAESSSSSITTATTATTTPTTTTSTSSGRSEQNETISKECSETQNQHAVSSANNNSAVRGLTRILIQLAIFVVICAICAYLLKI